MIVTPTASPASFRLELDGQLVPVKSIEGGAGVGVVVSSPVIPSGASPFREKHLFGVHYEAIAIQASFGSARLLFDWVRAAWQSLPAKKNGSAILVDAGGRPISRREFVNTALTETIVPKLDGASNEPGYVMVRLAPERTRDVTPPTTIPPIGPAPPSSLSSNFRLSIDGLDCTRVSKIDSFTVKQQGTLVEFPNLRIELASVSAESWRTWFRSFVIDGNSSPANEKTGTLSFLSATMATSLATISFHNLGIFRLENAPADASGTMSRVIAELYCERMDLRID